MNEIEKTRIRIRERFSQSPQKIFDYLSNHDHFVGMFAPRFPPMVVKRAGVSSDPSHPDGLGTIRKIGLTPIGPFILNEEIVEYEPGRALSYKALGKLFKYHLGQVRFQKTEYGTFLSYDIDFATFSASLDRMVAKQLPAGWYRGVRRNAELLGWLGSGEA